MKLRKEELMDYSLLAKSNLFQGIPEKDIRKVLEFIPYTLKSYAKNEVVFHLMEASDRLGIILKGRAESQKPFPDGSQLNVSIRKTGDIIGAAAVFSNNHKYPCDVVAMEALEVIIFKKEDFLLLIQKDIRLLENFTREISSATYMLQQKLALLSYSGIVKKVAFYLIMQKSKINSNRIPIPESITKWSMLMNVSRPSLHRELKRLEDQGIIVYKKHAVEILDFESLQEILEQ